MVVFEKYFMIFVVLLCMVSGNYAAECSCHCSGLRRQPVCENIENLLRIANTNTEKLLEWEKYRPFVERFSERWKREIADIVEMKIDQYIADGRFYPKPENLVSKLEDEMQNDQSTISKSSKDGSDIVSNLLVKVERVENKTLEVEEELKSERRVRRHLEEEVKETQSSLIFLGNQLQNVSFPVDNMMEQVQMVIYSSLDDMNKTYEEHLKKLYYKVDGVVYENETKKLNERIEHVETELHHGNNSGIISKLEGNVKILEENVQHLNDSIEGNLVPRIEIINNSIGDTLIPRIQTLETETVQKKAIEELEDRMTDLLNNTELLRTAVVDVWSNIQDIQNFEKKFHNFSEHWSTSFRELETQVKLLNESFVTKVAEPSDADMDNEIFQYRVNDTSQENSSINFQEVTPNVVNRMKISENTTLSNEDTGWEPEVTPSIVERSKITEDITTLAPEVTPDVAERKRIIEVSESIDMEQCDKPDIKDSNLLVDVVNDSNGRNHLKFGCRPIGLYVVSSLPVPPRCEGGSWKGPFPACTKLPNITTIENEDLNTLIPPILIEPNNVDMSGSHLGTGSMGQLIVHPRSSFTLHCHYPENIWGDLTWNVSYTNFTGANRRNLVLKEGKNKLSLTVTAAREEDSGIYKCTTPFGVQHSIEIVVKAIVCPPFTLDEEYEDVFYRPTPEGELRIMGSRAEFKCEGGRRIFAQCMANGNWSSGIPLTEDCKLKKKNEGATWNCKPFDVRKHPDLILEKNNLERIITFKCARGKRLVGNTYVRCRDDGLWSHISLPNCIN